MITRPFGDYVGPSAWKFEASEPLARPVRLHDADMELAARLPGISDEIALGRPDRGRIDALAVNALGAAATRTHDIELENRRGRFRRRCAAHRANRGLVSIAAPEVSWTGWLEPIGRA
jgi:hypothetical protein